MPGFRYCSWCNGKGCMCCAAEERKFNDKALAAAPKWRDPDIRDIRDAVVLAEFERGLRPGLDAFPDGSIDALTEDQVEAAFKPLLDAEYARQFPNGPQPMFTARVDNPRDMDLLKTVVGADVLRQAFGPQGRGIAEIQRRADEARAIQSQKETVGDE